MATKDYLTALKEYAAGGGKDINEFLTQHTVGKNGDVIAPGTTIVNAALTPPSQPASVAAKLAAADSAARLGIGSQPSGNVITNRALTPIPAESDALEARIAARNQPGGTVGQAANQLSSGAAPANTFAPTPRRIAPAFNVFDGAGAGGAVGAQQTTAQPAKETPWWQKSSFDSGFQKFINDNTGNRGRDASLTSSPTSAPSRPNQVINLSKDPRVFVPSSINYNDSSAPDYYKNFAR